MPERGKAAGGGLLRGAATLALAALAAAAVFRAAAAHRERRLENRGIGLLDAGRYQEAIAVLEPLRERTSSLVARDRIRGLLADCYQALAERPENSSEQSLAYYARLLLLDSDRVPETVRRRLQDLPRP